MKRKHMNKCPGWVKTVVKLLSKYMKKRWVNTLCKSNLEPGTILMAIVAKSATELLLDDASSKEIVNPVAKMRATVT